MFQLTKAIAQKSHLPMAFLCNMYRHNHPDGLNALP